MKCGYGCEKEAKFPPEKRKRRFWCCEKDTATCPAIRKKNSLVHLPENLTIPYDNKLEEVCSYGCGELARFKLIYNGKLCCSKTPSGCKKLKVVQYNLHKTTVEHLKETHPLLFREEEVRERNGEIEVRCKQCNKWFIPDRYQLRGRYCAIENPLGGTKLFFFCSEDCKYRSKDYHYSKRKTKNELKGFRTYWLKVQKYTERELKKKGDKLENFGLRGKKRGFSIDHKFSICDGFKNNVDSKIISNIKNLEIVEQNRNWKKNRKSTITLNNLLNLVEKENSE